MAEDSDLERTEPASERRIQEAREKGHIARSREWTTFAVLLGSALLLWWTAGDWWQGLRTLMDRQLRFTAAQLAQPKLMQESLHHATLETLMMFAPFLLGLLVVAAAAPMLVGGWLFSWNAVSPDFSRLSPAKGMARMFSSSSAAELVKTILKAGIIGAVGFYVLWSKRAEILSLMTEDFGTSVRHMGEITIRSLLAVIGAMSVIVLVDVPFQIWNYQKSLRMTKEELRQEAKEAEGDPQIKARIRQIQMQSARKRMMSQVPKADVIVTNPTHYAVALQYKEGEMGAPKIVAKGAFNVAERIVSLGQEHRVAILRYPPFARALYHHGKLDQEIPAALYQAAAEILAYVYQLKVYQTEGGVPPEQPPTLPVPENLDPLHMKKDGPAVPPPADQ